MRLNGAIVWVVRRVGTQDSTNNLEEFVLDVVQHQTSRFAFGSLALEVGFEFMAMGSDGTQRRLIQLLLADLHPESNGAQRRISFLG